MAPDGTHRLLSALLTALALGAPGAAQAMDQSQSVYCAKFSPDGKQVLSGGAGRKVQLWDVESGAELKSFEHPGWVQTVAFSPDGKYAVSGSRGCQMRLWDLTTGKMVHALNHEGWVVCSFFSADGKTCMSMGGDDAKAGKAGIRCWDAATGKQLRHLVVKPGTPLPYSTAALSADGKVLVSGGSGITVWDFEKGEPLRHLKEHGVWKLALSRDGATCVSAEDKAACVWSVKDGRLLATIPHAEAVRAVAISPDGKSLATGGLNGQTYLWDLGTYRELRRMGAHRWIVESLDFSPDGKMLVSGSFDGTVKLWEVGGGRLIRALGGK